MFGFFASAMADCSVYGCARPESMQKEPEWQYVERPQCVNETKVVPITPAPQPDS
jgi:hypothetical protein